MVLLLLTSCNRSNINGGHPLFIKAQNCFNDGNYNDAVKFYKRYLNINPDSVRANYQLAVIYQEQGDYIPAIFYYEKFLTLEPDTSDKKIIEEWIEASKQQLLKKLEKSADTDSINKQKVLQGELNKLKSKNEEMRNFILRHKDTIILNSETPVKQNKTITEKAQEKTSTAKIQKINKQQTYIVQPGDTLYGISNKFYGTPKFYKLIMKANQKLLNSSSKLIPGYKLIIPPKP